MKKSKLAVNFFGLFALFLLLLITGWICCDFILAKTGARQIAETKQRGNQILEALAQYKTEKGCYPEILNELIPRYLSEIKQPVWGNKKWDYKIFENSESYELSVGKDENNYPVLFNSGQDWYFDS